MVSATAPSNDVVGAASELVRQIAGPSTPEPYFPKDARALEAWVSALESRDPAMVVQDLERVIATDPDFGPPYRMLAERKAQSRDRDGALALLDTALARGNRMPEAERAHLEFEAASLRNDEVTKQRALLTLVKLEPRDPIAWRGLAETAKARRDYSSAVQSFRKVVELEPEDGSAWNELGYAAAYAGDFNTAVSALRRYQAVRPSDADPIDSLGDVNLLAGRLREAEELYVQAARKDPNFPVSAEMFKAAMARLMTGDVAGADALSKQYADAREAAHDALVETYRAEWSWLSGRRKAGVERLAAFARGAENGPLREAASRCYGELAVWALMLGDRAAADESSRKAVALAGSSNNGMAVVARFLAQPPATASEWAARIEQLFPNSPTNPVRGFALAYALLLSKEFAPASLVLKPIYEHNGGDADVSVPFLLAWTWLETGHNREADPLLRWNPVPPLTGPGALLSFHFPRVFYLRGVAAEKDGKLDEARKNYRLFLQLSGPDPLMWGEEKKAQASL
jgi:Flp pilus assembly protein TadD